MDKQYDGHVWMKTQTTNIINDVDLAFCSSTCIGHLQRAHRTSKVNDTQFEGLTKDLFPLSGIVPSRSTLVCRICKQPPKCIALVDDYIRAFLQVVAYYQFLKGGIGGDGPSKEKLKLRGAQRRAQRTGDPTVLQKVLCDIPGGEEFWTRDPHLEGAEVFGSHKQRPHTPIGDDGETHRPDIVNFSRPRPGKRVT
jgi:hypothetical protein